MGLFRNKTDAFTALLSVHYYIDKNEHRDETEYPIPLEAEEWTDRQWRQFLEEAVHIFDDVPDGAWVRMFVLTLPKKRWFDADDPSKVIHYDSSVRKYS